MLSDVRTWSKSFPARLTSLLPSACALCGCDAVDRICAPCRTRYLACASARCRCCAVSLGAAQGRCGSCVKTPPHFDRTVCAADYTAPTDQLVLALKFGNRLELAHLLAQTLADAMAEDDDRPALLIPVPLGSRRLVERGFNQALEIAKPLARMLGIPVTAHAVVRVRETGAQSMLHPDERRSNVTGAFRVQQPQRMQGLHVGVVDDVMTTGETLNELASALKQAGAARVTNIVFARTQPA